MKRNSVFPSVRIMEYNKQFPVVLFGALLFFLIPSPSLAEPSDVSYSPKIMYPEDSIILEVGETLNLTCRDTQKVVWRIPHETFAYYENYEELTEEGHELPYIAKLVIRDVTYLNVGYYDCIHNTTENKNKTTWSQKDANISSIYVYVRDVENLLAKDAFSVVYTPVVNQEFTLPCKPTFPEVTVTLEKIQGTYDPREGFTTIFTADDKDAVLSCQARYRDQPLISKDFVLYLVNSTHEEKLNKPEVSLTNYWQKNEIKDMSYGNLHFDVEEDQAVNLTCKTKHDITRERHLVWNLDTPNSKNQTGYHFLHRKIDTNNEIIRVLEIGQATPKRDSGKYSCSVSSPTSKSDEATIFIHVFSLNDSVIELHPESSDADLTESTDQDHVSWRILYSAYPDATFIWKKGDYLLFNSSNERQGSRRYKFVQTHLDGNIFLEIESPTLNDIGVYTLEGLIMDDKGKVKKSDSVQLNFTMPVKPSVPVIEFQGSSSMVFNMVPHNKPFKLVCRSNGYPKPKLDLLFSTCYNKDNCTEFVDIAQDSDDNPNSLKMVIADDTHFSPVNTTTIWNGTALAQGKYKCRSRNQHSDAFAEKTFLINDGFRDDLSIEVNVNGFNISFSKTIKVLEADNVTIICRGNKLNTKKHRTWNMNDESVSNKKILKTEKVNLTNVETDFSYMSVLKFTNLSMKEKSLKLSCEDTDTSKIISVMSMQIAPMRAPKWSTPGKPLQNYDLKEMGNLSMSCPATGAPEPEIKWYKNDMLLRNSEEINKKHRVIKGSTITFGYLKISDSGVYKCQATNRNGTIFDEATISIIDPDAFANKNIIIIVVVLSSILILVSIFLCRKIYKDRKREYSIRLADQRMFEEGNPDSINPDLGLDEQAELLPYDTKYEVSRDSIIFDKLLGCGAFGRVHRATALNLIPGQPRTTVAVKMMKSRTDCAQLKALRSEVKIMIHIGRHVNIVNLLGACSKDLASKGELLLLVEYCRHGNILDYMRTHRRDFIDQINEYDRIDPSITNVITRMRHASDTGSRSRMSRNLKYAHLSFNQDCVTYTPEQMQRGEPIESPQWPEPSTPTGSNGSTSNGHIPEAFRCRTISGSSAVHVTSDMSTMTFESSTGASDGYIGSRSLGTNPVTLCSKDLLCWAFQIARGMEYLAFKKVLHGDLAARNVLLADDNVVKISDFGLAKDIYKHDNYTKKSKTPLPWKWLAPECFRDNVFSTQSDIWSFGVVLWEIFSLGQNPYPGVDYGEEFLTRLEKGIRPEQPKYATHDIYRVMMNCWNNNPVERPSFSDLERNLGMMLSEAEKQHYLELNTPYQLENTTSTFMDLLQSPDYQAKMRQGSPPLDQDGYEMPFSPSPFGAMALPIGRESLSPRLTPLQLDYLQNDFTDGFRPANVGENYVPMSSPTRTNSTVFNFDKEAVDSIAKRDSEIQMEENSNSAVREENYLSMENSPNRSMQNSPNRLMQNSPNRISNSQMANSPGHYRGTIPLRQKLLRTTSQQEKHDSGLYSPTANLQCNPQYMIMDTFPTKKHDSITITKENVNDMYNGNNNHNYINFGENQLPCKPFQKNYIKDGLCNGEYTNLLPNGTCRGRTISETSSGLGSISEESPPESRSKPDSLKSSTMESVTEESVCV